MATKLANEAGRRVQLRRFGYRLVDEVDASINYEREWEVLLLDFKTRARPVVPAFGDLTSEVQAVARRYIEQRQLLDVLMNRCDAAHAEITRSGAEPELVEAYAVARDAYEDAVEAFGEARAEIEAMLA